MIQGVSKKSCVGRVKRDDPDRDNISDPNMLGKTPGLLRELAIFRAYPSVTSASKHYLKSQCLSLSCVGVKKGWSLRYPKSKWSCNLRCLFRASMTVETRLAEVPKWTTEKVMTKCGKYAAEFEHRTDGDIITKRCCILCGGSNLTN